MSKFFVDHKHDVNYKGKKKSEKFKTQLEGKQCKSDYEQQSFVL